MNKYSERSKDEIETLREATLNHPHHFIRRKALSQLLYQHGIHHTVIEGVLGVCENTLRVYCQGYQDKGLAYITAINFKKPESKLIPFKDAVLDYLDKTPPGSIKQASEEIGELTGVHIHESQMRHYLKKIGARCLRVCAVPAKADIEKQKNFKEKELEPRLQEAKEGLRDVFFIDAAHFVLQAFLGKVWSVCRVFIRSPSGRQRFNVLGALNAITKEVELITNSTYITSLEVCELLKNITKKNMQFNTKNLKEMELQRNESDFKETTSTGSAEVDLSCVKLEESHPLTQEFICASINIKNSEEKSNVDLTHTQEDFVVAIPSRGIETESSEELKTKPMIENLLSEQIIIQSDQKEIPEKEPVISKKKKKKTKDDVIPPPKKEKKIPKSKDTIQQEKEDAARAQAEIEAKGLRVITPVTVFLDNAGYQRCLLVTSLAKALGIELLFLPPYSPNLNLIERLWKLTKKEVLNSKYYSTFDPFQRAIRGFLENMTITHSKELKSLLTLQFQTFTKEQMKKAI